MLNFCRRHDGAISVFLTLILIPTFLFGGVIIDGSRILGAKNLISGAGDLAMNGALSNYYEELNQTYGLLAMADTAQEVQDVMQQFFKTSLNASGVDEEDFSKALVYLELTNNDFFASNVVDTEIYQTEVIRQEMLEYMKYRAPVTLINRAITDRLGDLENMEKEKKAADGELKFESSLNDMQKLFDDIKELADRQQEIYRQTRDENGYNRLLGDTESSYDKISLLGVTLKRLNTCRDTESGDTLALMEEMVDLSGGTGSLNADGCSRLIEMKMIENSMKSRNKYDILEDLDRDSDEYERREKLIDDYDDAEEELEERKKDLEQELKKLVENTYKTMHEQRDLADEGQKKCAEIKEKLQELKDEFEKLREKYDNWKEAVDRLPAGESKEAYEESIEDVSGFFEAEGVIADFENDVKNNETFYREVRERLDAVTLGRKRIDKDVKSSEDVLNMIDEGFVSGVKDVGSLTAKAGQFMTDKYNSPGTMSLSVQKKDISQDAFFIQLRDFYCNTGGGNQEEADRAADEWKGRIDTEIEKLSNLLLCEDLPDADVMSMGHEDLPTKWLGISDENVSESDISIEGGIQDKDSRKAASENGSDNLNTDNANLSEMSSLGDKLNRGVESAIEPLLLTEYVMGMFSHNTSDRDENGNEISDPLTINRSQLKTNEIYRAEIEYILWGDRHIRNNARATKAIIFTANLVFNMSFAFTNRAIRGDANTIAAFFPVGPLAKTAIKCAVQAMVAMIETTRNMIDLMDGKRVALIKTANAWDTWIFTRAGTGESKAGFTYEDYVWILICVNMYIPSKQNKLLGRTADMIELNMTESKEKADNTLKDKYTMIEIEASVKIKTFFMQKLSGAGYDVRAVGDNDFTISYYGIQGY